VTTPSLLFAAGRSKRQFFDWLPGSPSMSVTYLNADIQKSKENNNRERKMKVCVVGLGYWGPNLVRNFLAQNEVRGVVCVDKDPAKLKRAQIMFPSVSVSENYTDALKDPEVEAVAIATPVGSHYALAIEALENGKHVFVEKPMTRTVEQAENLVKRARELKRVLMVDHTFLFTSAIQKMGEVIKEGGIGDLLYFDSVRINLGLFQSDVNVIWDLAPHDLSILLHLFQQRPNSVLARGMDHFDHGSENMAYLTLTFEEKLMAHFHLSWLSPVKIRRIILGGSRKMIVYDDMESNEKVKIFDKGVEYSDEEEQRNQTLVQYRTGDIHVPALENKEALQGELEHFLACIRNSEKPLSDGEEGLWVVRILEAADESLKSGRTVSL
jgi:predicted dehydrogenase